MAARERLAAYIRAVGVPTATKLRARRALLNLALERLFTAAGIDLAHFRNQMDYCPRQLMAVAQGIL